MTRGWCLQKGIKILSLGRKCYSWFTTASGLLLWVSSSKSDAQPFLLKFVYSYTLKKKKKIAPSWKRKKEELKLNPTASLSDHGHLLMFIIFQDYGEDHEVQCMDTPNVLWWANVWVGIALQEELMVDRWMRYCKNKHSEAARSSPGCEKLAEIAPAAIKTLQQLGDSGISAPLLTVFNPVACW